MSTGPGMRALALVLPLLVGSCTGTVVEDRVVHRDNCLVCHQPRGADGVPVGIEEAHPWYALACADCHGGSPRVCDGEMQTGDGEPRCNGTWVYDKERAHVSAGDGPTYLKNLSSQELDQVDPAYLRFINPGDLRVVDQTCGLCHAQQAEAAKRSTMAHTAGEITVARYRAGAQDVATGVVAADNLTDPNWNPADLCSVENLTRMDPPPMSLTSTNPATQVNVANAQDLYMAKSCMRCHTADFGENRLKGDFRSSGCTSCHMPYGENGISQSSDPRIIKSSPSHPLKHQMTKVVEIETCTHCHYRGGRLGISYQGYRESASAGFNPPNTSNLGRGLHGQDPAFYLTDEDTTNDHDETPPDIHFEAGMVCSDCHTSTEVHGDGHLYADTQCAVKTRCEDCHGDARNVAQPQADRPNLLFADGGVFLRLKKTGEMRAVTQVADLVTPGNPRHSPLAERAMGVNTNGFSHSDKMECYTCHASWLPSCYGCHVNVDMTRQGRIQTTGVNTDGYPSGKRKYVVLNDLVLLRNTDGKLAPSMPAERFFMTVEEKDEQASADAGRLVKRPVLDTVPRAFPTPDGGVVPGFGQRAFNPHTTRARSQFMACDRCHSVGSATAPTNQVLLDLTHGYGTQRFPFDGCTLDPGCSRDAGFMTYQLDRVLHPDGTPAVVVGHPYPDESRPLTPLEISGMRDVVVSPDEPYSTDIPPDARTNPNWPVAPAY